MGLAIYMDAVPNKHRSPLFFFVFDTLETHLCFSLFLHPVNAYQIAIKKLHKLPLLPFIQASRQITGYCFTYKVLYKSTRTFSQLEKNRFTFADWQRKALPLHPTITTSVHWEFAKKFAFSSKWICKTIDFQAIARILFAPYQAYRKKILTARMKQLGFLLFQPNYRAVAFPRGKAAKEFRPNIQPVSPK